MPFVFHYLNFEKKYAKCSSRQKLSAVLLRTVTERNCDLYSLHGIRGWLGILALKNKS